MLPFLEDSFFVLRVVHQNGLSPSDDHRHYRLFLWLGQGGFRCCVWFRGFYLFTLRLLIFLLALFLWLKLTQSAHWLHNPYCGCRRGTRTSLNRLWTRFKICPFSLIIGLSKVRFSPCCFLR